VNLDGAGFSSRAAGYVERIRQSLDRWLPPAQQHPTRLHQAIRYACDGGKRLRPLLIYAAGEVLDVPARSLDATACAIELIHAYSLIHDDLPSIDDDELRRGRPTVHKAFDEATAVLAGDGLQALAFYVLAHEADSGLDPRQRLKMIEVLPTPPARAAWSGGKRSTWMRSAGPVPAGAGSAAHPQDRALVRACMLLVCYAKSPLNATHMAALDATASASGWRSRSRTMCSTKKAGSSRWHRRGQGQEASQVDLSAVMVCRRRGVARRICSMKLARH